MKIENLELFTSFLDKNLKNKPEDCDEYLEELIIHWGETGEETFSLNPEDTVSGQPETISYTVKTCYYIRENGKEVPVEDLSEGYDVYRPVLQFNAEAPEPMDALPLCGRLNPIALIRHKSGRTLKTVSAISGLSPEELLKYEDPAFDVGTLPLATAAAIAKALSVHAEALLTCGPAMPRNR